MIRRTLIRALSGAAFALALPAAAGKPDVAVPEGLRVLVGFDKVVMLTTTWCGYCKQLKRELQAAGVPFKEWDIEHSDVGRRARERLPGGRSVPVTVVGDQVVFGAKSERIVALAKS